MNKEKFIKFLEKMSIESYIYENTISFDIESSRYPTQHYCINVDESSITRYYGEDDEEFVPAVDRSRGYPYGGQGGTRISREILN